MRFLRGRRAVLLAAPALVLVGLGALWTQWLVSEVGSGPAQQGHHDFFAFYAAGSLIHRGQPGALYDSSVITAVERHILDAPVGAAGYMPFLNPPAAAAALAPFSLLSEPIARVVWLLIGVVIAMACVMLATAGLRRELRLLAGLLLLLSFPAFQALVEGQWSFVLLLGALGALTLARRGHRVFAGVALAALWLKPPLLLLALVWVVAQRRWRIALATVATVVAVTLIALPWTGAGSNLTYVGFLGGVTASHAAGAGALGATPWEGGLLGMEGLLGLAATIAGQQHAVLVDVLTIVFSASLFGWYAVATWGRLVRNQLTARDGIAAVLLALLLDPHLYAQDCLLLVVALAIALRETRTVAAQAALIIGCAAVMDLAALDTLWTGGMPLWPPHLFTLALAAGVVVLTARRPANARARIAEPRAVAGSAG